MSLKIANLSKRIDDKWILRDVSFEAENGEIFGLIGANDLETLSILQMINDAKTSDADTISFNENGLAEKSVTVFPAFEEKNFRQKFFPQKLKINASKSEKIKDDFEILLNVSENILLLNNPFCCLNENLRDELILSLRNAAGERNLTVILATNNADEIFAACDRVGVLKNGSIAQIGTARDLYEKPNSAAVAHALGRCNFIKAMRVSFTNQQSQEFQTLNGEHRLLTDKSEKAILGAINATVTLAIRPEHISISFGASFPEDNLLRAKIADVCYRGATTRIILDAGGLTLEALVLRLVGLKIGDECMVGLPPDRIRVLKD